jgi:ferric-dicitrate binding protein FerR (iron transport regulator)
MNTEDKYALAAARVLREQMPASPEVREPANRDHVVAAMELALAQQSRRRRVVRTSGWVLAAAAGVVLVLKLTHTGVASVLVEQIAGPGNTLLRQGQSQALAKAASLSEGDEILSGEKGSATLGLGRGTTLVLASASQMRLIEAGQSRRFFLLRGQVDASVAKLRPNERLLVATPDSEVEVRGTRFSVKVTDAPEGCGGARQRSTVEVQQGTVWVRSQGEEKVLNVGQSFTRACETPALVPPAPEAVAPVIPAAPAPEARKPASLGAPRRRAMAEPVRSSEPVRAPVVAAEPASQLAEQNDLLSSAMAAARAGQNDLAIRRLDALLSRFPEGPLGETARIERQRIKSAQTIQH